MSQAQLPNVIAAGDAASRLQLRAIAFSVAEARHMRQQELPPPLVGVSSGAVTSAPPIAAPGASVTQPSTGGVWACIANAETNGIPAMGPDYWTVFGVVTGVVTGWGTPQEQHDIFAGTASFGEQLDVATRFAAEKGFGGWGYLTREKCNL